MPRGGMSKEHKEALARGRRQSKAVRGYLEALEVTRRPGRPVTRESLEKRVAKLQTKVDQEENAARRVDLIQERLDAERQLEELTDRPDVDALEKEFVDVAAEYSERKGITYSAWREAGVPAATLKAAGIPRTRRPSG